MVMLAASSALHISEDVQRSTNLMSSEHVHQNLGVIIGHEVGLGPNVSNPDGITWCEIQIGEFAVVVAGALVLQARTLDADSVVPRDLEANVNVGVTAR